MAISSTVATIIAAASTLIGTGVGALGQMQQAKAAQRQADFQSAVQRQQAERERQIAEAQAEDSRARQRRLMAARRAALGGAGIEGGTGSPLLAAQDFAAESELQALRLLSGGEAKATRLEQQATLTRMQGRAQRSAGRIAAGSSLLGGIGRTARILHDSPLVS